MRDYRLWVSRSGRWLKTGARECSFERNGMSMVRDASRQLGRGRPNLPHGGLRSGGRTALGPGKDQFVPLPREARERGVKTLSGGRLRCKLRAVPKSDASLQIEAMT